MSSTTEPTAPKRTIEESLRTGFTRHAAADTDALERVHDRAWRRFAHSGRPSEVQRWKPRRRLLIGTAAGLALAVALSAVFLLGDLRSPTGAYIIDRARAERAAARQPGKVTHERVVETYWDRDYDYQGTERSFALTGTVVTESWRDYGDVRVRIAQWVDLDGKRVQPMTSVRAGTHSITSAGDSSALSVDESVGIQGTDRPLYRIHRAIATPAFANCAVCHAVYETAPDPQSQLNDRFSDDESLVRTLLKLGFLENAGRDEIDGREVWVLRSEGTTEPANVPTEKRSQRWLLEMYVDLHTYRLVGAQNQWWTGQSGSALKLDHKWTFRLEASEALDPATLPRAFFTPSLPADGIVDYTAVVGTASANAFDVAPLYWLGPLVDDESVVSAATTAHSDAAFAVRRPDAEDAGQATRTAVDADTTSLPELEASIGYTAVGTEETGVVEDQTVVRTFRPLSPSELALWIGPMLTRDTRIVTRRIAGRTVSVVQTASRTPFDRPLTPYRTSEFYVHFSDATVRIDGLDGYQDDGRIGRIIGLLKRAN